MYYADGVGRNLYKYENEKWGNYILHKSETGKWMIEFIPNNDEIVLKKHKWHNICCIDVK